MNGSVNPVDEGIPQGESYSKQRHEIGPVGLDVMRRNLVQNMTMQGADKDGVDCRGTSTEYSII